MTTWAELGVAVTAEVATSGDIIIGGTQTALPFVSGGPSGVPLGWLAVNGSAGAAAVNRTTDTSLNRFSISNAAGVSNAGSYWGGEAYFTVKEAFKYRVSVNARVMDGKQGGRYSFVVSSYKAGVFVKIESQVNGDASTDWQTFTLVTGFLAAGVDQLRISLQAGSQLGAAQSVTWGVQYNDLGWVEEAPAPPAIEWHDLTCDVQGLAVRYGRERFTSRYDVATATLVLKNESGDYTYRVDHPFGFRPGRLLRVNAHYQGTDYPLYYGVIQSIGESYTFEGQVLTNVSLADPTSLYSNTPTPGVGGQSWNSQLSGWRINTLLTAVGYKDRAVDAGQFRMQDITPSDRSLRDELGVTADSEGGSVFADRTGRIVYKDRTWLTTDPRLMQVQANLLAQPDLDSQPPDQIPTSSDAVDVCVNELNTEWSLERVINLLSLANAGYTAETFSNEQSQRDYGIYTYSRTDFVNDDYYSDLYGYLATRANDIMGGYSEPVLRVTSISFKPGPDTFKFALSVFLNWLVRVWYLHPFNNWGYTVVLHVQSIEHKVTPTGWETTLTVDLPAGFTEWGGQSVNGWDGGKWDQALWDQGNDVVTYWNSGQKWNDPAVKWGK